MEPGLQQYLKQINESPLLSAEEERDLARTITAGDQAGRRFARGDIGLQKKEELEQEAILARDRMIRSNLRLVVNIAKGYSRRGMPLSDLIEEGNLGLLKAVEGFNPDHGARFSTYASWWIKQAIKRALINTIQPVHIPAYMVELIARWKEVHQTLEEELGHSPDIKEVAARMEMPERKVRIIKRAVRAYNAPTQGTDEQSGLALTEMLPDEKSMRPEEVILSEHETRLINQMLNALTDPREVTILKLRYGLTDQEPMTLKEIGKQIGLTRERVRQLETEALRKLHTALSEKL